MSMAALLDDQTDDAGLDNFDPRRRGHRGHNRLSITMAVGLTAGRMYGGALASAQGAELNTRGVGHDSHQATKGVELLDHLALAQAADGRIAAHLAKEPAGEGQELDLRAQARRRQGRFDASVAAPHHDKIDGFGLGPGVGVVAALGGIEGL